MATVKEVKEIVERMEDKVGVLSVQLAAHIAADQANLERLSELWGSIHGDGNGRRGIRRELDDVRRIMERYERLSGIITAAAITSAITAAIGIFVR